MTTETFDQWGLIELFGHARIAGRITEQTVGGAAFIRVDVPATSNGIHPPFTRLLGASAIYAINPLDEPTTRNLVDTIKAAPVQPYEFQPLMEKMVNKEVERRALPDGNARHEDDHDDDDDENMPFS